MLGAERPTVKADCNHCNQQVKVEPERVTLYVDSETKRGSYAFACECGEIVVKAANSSVVNFLAEGYGIAALPLPDIAPDTIADPAATVDDLLEDLQEFKGDLDEPTSENIWNAFDASEGSDRE